MLKNLCKKLAAAGAVVALAAGAALAGAAPRTNTVTAVLDVAPGERRCLTHPTRALYNASVYDFVVSGEPVKFVFLGNGGASEFIEISNSGPYPVLGYSDYINAPPSSPPSFFPSFFPGFFRTCARNTGTQPSTVSLSLTVDR